MRVDFHEIPNTGNPQYPYGVAFTVGRDGRIRYGVDIEALYTMSLALCLWCGERFEFGDWKCEDQGFSSARILFKRPEQVFEAKLRWAGVPFSDFEQGAVT